MNFRKSIINMLLAGIFFFLMSLTVKSLDRIPISQIVFFRAWVALLLCLVSIKRLGIPLWGTNKKLLIYRGAFGTGALILFFSTLHNMPMSTAVIIQYLSPIFTTLLAAIFLGERVKHVQWPLFLIALLGIVLVKGIGEATVSLPWLLAGLFGALFSAAAYTCIGKIGSKEHPLTIILYFPLITVPVIAVPTYLQWTQPNLMEWILLILVGVLVQIAQYFMTLSYQHGRASVVSIISYLGVFYAAIAGYFIFDEPIVFTTVLGGGMIILAVSANTLLASRK